MSDRSGSYEIWTIRPDGSDLEQLTDNPDLELAYPRWSPDGKLLGGIRLMEGLRKGITIYSLESQEYERLKDFGGRPVWLNDSRRLVFASSGNLFLLDSETGDVQELFAPSLGSAIYPTVSRDNRTLYFTLSNTEADIWLLELN